MGCAAFAGGRCPEDVFPPEGLFPPEKILTSAAAIAALSAVFPLGSMNMTGLCMVYIYKLPDCKIAGEYGINRPLRMVGLSPNCKLPFIAWKKGSGWVSLGCEGNKNVRRIDFGHILR